MTVFSGRLKERHLMRAMLERRAPGLIVVRGPSGVGKTALVEKVLQELAPAAPIVGRAKYADQTSSAGLRPVVDALSQAVDAALGRLYDPASGAASLRALLGIQYGALLAAGFAAEGVTGGEAPPVPRALTSHEGTVRLIDALARVLQWLEGFALPVVLFVDDWHRAPNEAVGFVHACSQRGEASLLKLVLAIRGDGSTVYPGAASFVDVEPLASAQQLELLTGLLEEPARAHAVVDWLGANSSGLPFDLCQIALALDREGAFVGAGASQRVDPQRVIAIDNSNIDDIITQRARTLAPDAVRLGMAAALWGDRAPLDLLGRCLGQSRAATQAAAATLQVLSNAVKYTTRGGIVVGASVSEAPDGKARIALAVEDTGPGIPEERLAHLFEPFDRAGRQDSKGLGLGLLLSRRIAERMGGSLTAENRQGGGTRFVLSFVAAKGDAAGAPRVEPGAAARALSILIVEDASHIRRLIARLLALDGHDVTEAESLGQGLERARGQKFDLLLLDLQLADGDGLSLLEQWPAEQERPRVIVLTADVAREAVERVKQTGSILLRKPISAAELRAAIARACGGARSASPPPDFDAAMASLIQEAREEIVKRTADLVELVEAGQPLREIRQHAHKLAGLAAQFGAAGIADAADRIEQACAGGVAPADCLFHLKDALAERRESADRVALPGTLPAME